MHFFRSNANLYKLKIQSHQLFTNMEKISHISDNKKKEREKKGKVMYDVYSAIGIGRCSSNNKM